MSPVRHPVRWTFVPFLLVATFVAWVLSDRTGLVPLLAWIAAANLCALPVWWIDKLQARRAGRRVPESTLHLVSVLGAAPAALVSMSYLRHKTQKPWFWVVNVLLLLLQGIALVWIYGPSRSA